LWIDDPALERDADFAEALARGLSRLAEFVGAVRVDASAVKPMRLRKHLDVRLKVLAIQARPASGRAR
jgi:hypothetical protein